MGNNDAPAALLWSTSKLVKTNSMFKNAVAFDQDIGVVTADKWNVGNVVDMTSMFEGAIFYNNDNNVLTGKLLNLWDVGKVTSFMNMFKGALRYNKSLTAWSVDSGTNFNDMFNAAAVFKQNLCAWQNHAFLSTETNADIFIATSCPKLIVDVNGDAQTGDVCCSCIST